MFKDLIEKLLNEAAEQADHKAWCDTELSSNELTRKEKAEQPNQPPLFASEPAQLQFVRLWHVQWLRGIVS